MLAGLWPNVVRIEESKDGKGGKADKGGKGASAKATPPKIVAQVALASGKSKEERVQIHPCSVREDSEDACCPLIRPLLSRTLSSHLLLRWFVA